MKRWDINLKLWYNMLILNNGVALFLLYRNLARAKEKAVNANQISICEENSSKNGVKTINRILLLSSQYSGEEKFNSESKTIGGVERDSFVDNIL
jgi:hypothetical protein